MPAPMQNRTNDQISVGVDGCPGGWVAVWRSPNKTDLETEIWEKFANLADALKDRAAAMMVDMPIGLADAGRRVCEARARAALRPYRGASVFPSPRRPMLEFDTYEAANRWGKNQGPGGGLTKQTWNILGKIRELDRYLTPARQALIAEAHPELAFCRLNDGIACRDGKRTLAGREQRLALLSENGIEAPIKLYETLKNKYGAKAINHDDVIDACALLLTAEARLAGTALHMTDGACDARGLVMEIWG